MGDIKAFLQPPVMDETKEVIISKRFKGEDGKPVPFVIRAIDQETNDKIIKISTETQRINGQDVTRLNSEKYNSRLICDSVVTPNFKNSEICDYYKTNDPTQVPGRMLSSGEYANLLLEISKINGFLDTEEKLAKAEEEAKN